MSELTIEVDRREEKGKNAARRLRVAGQVPAVVYGTGKEAVPIQVRRRKVEELLRSGSGENTIFLLQLAGTSDSRHALIRELQVDHVTGEMLHIDFQRINMSEAVHVTVPVELMGTAAGVKNDGGVLDFVTRALEIECLPNEIPQQIEVDVSELEIGDHIEAGQLDLSKELTLLEDENRLIVSIAAASQVEEEEAEEEDEGLVEEGADEPEVISRGKAEE